MYLGQHNKVISTKLLSMFFSQCASAINIADVHTSMVNFLISISPIMPLLAIQHFQLFVLSHKHKL